MRRAQSAIFLFISFLFPSTRCAHHACSNLMYSCFHSNIHALRVFLVCISWIRVAVAVAVAVTEIAYRYFKKRACMQHCAQSHIASMVSTFANFGRGRRPHFATCGDSSNLLTISRILLIGRLPSQWTTVIRVMAGATCHTTCMRHSSHTA